MHGAYSPRVPQSRMRVYPQTGNTQEKVSNLFIYCMVEELLKCYHCVGKRIICEQNKTINFHCLYHFIYVYQVSSDTAPNQIPFRIT